MAIKIPNSADAVEELNAEVESLSVLTHGALQLFCSCCCLMHPNRLIEQIACDRKCGPDSGDDGRPGPQRLFYNMLDDDAGILR